MPTQLVQEMTRNTSFSMLHVCNLENNLFKVFIQVNPGFILEDRCCVFSWKSQFDLKVLISYVFLVAERSLHYFLSQKDLSFNIPLYVT